MSLYSNIGYIPIAAPVITLDGYEQPFTTTDEMASYPYNTPLFPDPWYTLPNTLMPSDPYIMPPVIDSTNETSDGTLSDFNVTGFLFDKKTNKPVNGATIQIIRSATNEKLTDKSILPQNSYNVWATDGPANYSALFEAKGYKSLLIPFTVLASTPDIYLEGGSNTIPLWAILAVIAAVAYYNSRRKKVGAFGPGDVTAIFLLLGGVIAFSLVSKILNKLGLWGGQDVIQQQKDPGSAWKPAYYHQFNDFSYVISFEDAEKMAFVIYNSLGIFQDDFNTIMAVINEMKTKANVSFLAEVFQQKHGDDLLSFLQSGTGVLPWDGLSNEHMTTILNYVKNLPSH